MCWIGKCDLKIAQEDISIFKVLYKSNNLLYSEKTFISIYRDFPYTLNKEVESEIEMEPWKSGNIDVVFKALHSYDPKSTSFVKIAGTRVHLYHNDSHGWLGNFFIDNCVRANGIIPKGSAYALNDTGEYISNRIILKEVESLV